MKNSKIRVMHIRDSKGIYGAERVILTLGKHLDKKTFDFSLLCMLGEDGKSRKLIEKARSMEMPVIPLSVRGKVDVKAAMKIRSILEAERISIIHTHDYKSDFYGLAASSGMKVKRVLTAHGSTRDSWRKKAYLLITENVVYRFYDRIIAVSERVASELGSLHLRKKALQVIQNGIDFSLLEEKGGSATTEEVTAQLNGRKVFGVIGRLFPDKGHQVFLEAFSPVVKQFPEVAAVIVGDGPFEEAIKAQIERLNLRNHVFLWGFRADMKNVYDKVHFIVIPSLREGLPYVLLEALAAKTPVLATGVGDIPLLIQDGVTGLLVKPGDKDALERKMMEMLGEPGRAAEMADRGYQLVMDKFSHVRMVRLTEELYRTVLA